VPPTSLASIIFTDIRHARRFAVFPMPQPFREVVGMIPGELRRRPGTIGIPATVTEREYGLVVVGPDVVAVDQRPHSFLPRI
jgi:hypothetical protein